MPRGRSPCTQAPSAPSISELDPRCFQGRIASVVLSSSAVEGFQNLDSARPKCDFAPFCAACAPGALGAIGGAKCEAPWCRPENRPRGPPHHAKAPCKFAAVTPCGFARYWYATKGGQSNLH